MAEHTVFSGEKFLPEGCQSEKQIIDPAVSDQPGPDFKQGLFADAGPGDVPQRITVGQFGAQFQNHSRDIDIHRAGVPAGTT